METQLPQATEAEPLPPVCFAGHQLSIKDGFCRQCAICNLCSKPLDPSEYFYALRQADRESEKDFIVNPVFVHTTCFTESELSILTSETVTIPRALFNKLNACRLIFEPLILGGQGKDEILEIKTNENDAEIKTNDWIHESAKTKTADEHLEYLYFCLRRMESASAALSLAISKHRRSVELNLDKKYAEQAEQARKDRKKASENPTPRTREKVETAQVKKAVTREEKAIASFMKVLGCTEAEARAMVQKAPPATSENGEIANA